MDQGNTAQAIEVFNLALARAPGDSDTNLAFGLALVSAGEIDGAIGHFESMVVRGAGGSMAANNFAALVADHRFEDTSRLERAYDVMRDFEGSLNPAFVDTPRVDQLSARVTTKRRNVL